MAGINKVILVGNLGKDPEVKYLDSGVAVANFSLATTESYKNKEGERVNQTEWHNIVVRNKLAEICEKYLSKGDKVYCEGRIKTRQWEQDGQKRYTTEIHVNNMTFLSTKNETSNTNSQNTPSQPKPNKIAVKPIVNDEDDDLPF